LFGGSFGGTAGPRGVPQSADGVTHSERKFHMPIWENVVVLAREKAVQNRFPGNGVTAKISVIIQNNFLHHKVQTSHSQETNLYVED